MWLTEIMQFQRHNTRNVRLRESVPSDPMICAVLLCSQFCSELTFMLHAEMYDRFIKSRVQAPSRTAL